MSAVPDALKADPQALLAEAMKAEAKKGRLKIFLGYAPGVGKTYKMLEQAHELKTRGADVVVGLVETHGRAEADELLQGLEIIPRRKVPYKNLTLEEMNLEGILKRKPSLVIVDELAHTNASGSLHEKRYQDVEMLLDQGIQVYTAVNIQHVESLNDTIAQITGVHVRETIPDGFLDQADEIDVVDLPIEELQARLKEGKVYAPDLAGSALENFFKRGNLLALRELALRRVASKLDQELITYMKARGVAGPWATSERLLVCVGASPYAPRLVRKAFQMASHSKAEWYAAYVETPKHMALTQKERAHLTETLGLAQELGAKVVTLSGTETSEEIIRFAASEKVSKVVIGKPTGSNLRQMFYRSPVYEILKSSGGFDVYLIAPSEGETSLAGERKRQGVRLILAPWKNYALASLSILPVWTLAAILFYGFNIQSLVTLFVLAPLVSAFFYGIGPSLFVSVLAAVVYDFFFTEPYFSLRIAKPDVVLDVVIFVATSVLAAQVAKLMHRQKEALGTRLGQMELLAEMGKELLAIPNIEQLLARAAEPLDEHARNTLKLMKTTCRRRLPGPSCATQSGRCICPVW